MTMIIIMMVMIVMILQHISHCGYGYFYNQGIIGKRNQ